MLIFGMCRRHDVSLGDSRDCGMRSDKCDVDADGMIRIFIEGMTCNLQSSMKRGYNNTKGQVSHASRRLESAFISP